EDGIRDFHVTGVQTCALPIFIAAPGASCRPAFLSSPAKRRKTGLQSTTSRRHRESAFPVSRFRAGQKWKSRFTKPEGSIKIKNMFSRSQKNGIEYLHSELLSHCDFLVHAFGTRIGGVSRDDY